MEATQGKSRPHGERQSRKLTTSAPGLGFVSWAALTSQPVNGWGIIESQGIAHVSFPKGGRQD